MTPDLQFTQRGHELFRSRRRASRGLGRSTSSAEYRCPIDQCGHVAESPQRRAIQITHRAAYRRPPPPPPPPPHPPGRACREQLLSRRYDGAVAGREGFLDRAGIPRRQIAMRVESEIRAATWILFKSSNSASRFAETAPRNSLRPSANNSN